MTRLPAWLVRIASVAGVLGGCLIPLAGAVADSGSDSDAGVDPANLPPEMTRSLEDLLNDPEGVEPDRKETRCINRRGGVRIEILDSEHLLIRSAVGGRAWLNRLSPGCIGMRPDMVLIVDGRGSGMCHLDSVRARSRAGVGGITTGRCSLGKFEPITPLHAKTLEDSFKLRSKEMEEARRNERIAKRKERKKQRKERRAQRKAAKAAKAAEAST